MRSLHPGSRLYSTEALCLLGRLHEPILATELFAAHGGVEGAPAVPTAKQDAQAVQAAHQIAPTKNLVVAAKKAGAEEAAAEADRSIAEAI